MQDQPVEICRDSIPGACISLRFFILFLRSIFHLFQKSIHESVLYLFVGQCPHTRFAGQKNNLYNGKG